MTYWTDSFFYLAFAAQIFLLSSYFPSKIEARMRRLLDDYPPTSYPKLYPRPAEYYRKGVATFRLANRIILILGIALMAALLFVVDHASFADDGYISEFWPLAYFALQSLPLIALELMEAGQFRLMRNANISRRRDAVLQRRQLFDFVSPRLLTVTLVCIVATVFVDFYVHDFVMSFGHDTVQRTLWLLGANLFFAVIGARALYGKKLNPHQSAADRARLTTATLWSMAYVSIAMSVFFLLQALDDVYPMNFLDATIASVYLLSIMALSLGTLLNEQPLDKIDFDVYRDNGAPVS